MNDAETGILIQLDGASRMLALGTSLAALVHELGHAPASVGTAVNGHFVARAQRHDRLLQAGDEVLLFQPIVGG
jgi:sulfur carrier protein